MNYLTLCQELVSELGLSGGTGPAAVTGNTIIELKNATRWIRDASLQIDNLWFDWKYLWTKYSQTGVVVNSTGLAAPTAPACRMWDLNKMRFRPSSGGSWSPMTYYSRQRLYEQFDTDNASATSPGPYTINPDQSIVFAAPLDQAYDFKGEYWATPTPLAANTDVPALPSHYHRIIMCRAGIMYGNREDAPEVISGMEAEYIDMLDKLQSDQLEGWELRRSSTDRQRQSESGANQNWSGPPNGWG